MASAEEIDWSNFTFQHGFRQPRPKLFDLAHFTGAEPAAGVEGEGTPVKTDAAVVKQEGGPVKMEVDSAAPSPLNAEPVGPTKQ